MSDRTVTQELMQVSEVDTDKRWKFEPRFDINTMAAICELGPSAISEALNLVTKLHNYPELLEKLTFDIFDFLDESIENLSMSAFLRFLDEEFEDFTDPENNLLDSESQAVSELNARIAAIFQDGELMQTEDYFRRVRQIIKEVSSEYGVAGYVDIIWMKYQIVEALFGLSAGIEARTLDSVPYEHPQPLSYEWKPTAEG